jgi:hypothetical protein
VGTDNGSTTCTAAYSGNDVRITNTGGGNVVIASSTGTEGFMYLITTDSDVPATDATSYMDASIDSDTEDSSKITISGPTAPNLTQSHYRWRNDNGIENGGSGTLTVTATATDTTTNTNYELLDSMTLTPGAGDYVASFTASFEGTSSSKNFVQFFVNGVAVDHTEREQYQESSIAETGNAATIFAFLENVGDSQDVEVRWKTTSSDTATCYQRTLTLQSVTDTDISQATATVTDTTSSSTDTLMDSMTVTPGTAGNYLVYFSTSMYGVTNTRPTCSVYVGGTKVDHSERENYQEGSLGDVDFIMGLVVGVAVGATDDVEIKWRSDGDNGMISAKERTLVVQKVSSYSQGSATLDDTTSSTSYTALDSMSVTPGTAGDYLAFFTSSIENSENGVNNVMQASLFDAGSQVAHSERRAEEDASCPSTSLPIASHAYIEDVGASDAISVQYLTPSGTALVSERTLVATESTSTTVADWAANQDTKLTGLDKLTNKRLRFEISNEGTASATGIEYRLEVSEANPTDCASASTWTRIDSSTHWDMVDTDHYDDGDPSEDVSGGLDNENTTFVAGELKKYNDGTNDDQTTGINLTTTQFTEIEYNIQATASATAGATYCFRLTDAGDASDFTYSGTGVYAEVSLTLTATLANHAAGQEPDRLEADSSVTGEEFFAFQITNSTGSTVTLNGVEFQLSSVDGMLQGDFDNFYIYVDADGSGDIEGSETTKVCATEATTAISASTGTITFSSCGGSGYRRHHPCYGQRGRQCLHHHLPHGRRFQRLSFPQKDHH